MTAVGVHVGDVGFQFDVWVEVVKYQRRGRLQMRHQQ